MDMIRIENTIEFTLEDCKKEFTFKELTIRQRKHFQKRCKEEAKKAWLNRLNDVSATMDKQERTKFLLEAVRTAPKLDDEQAWTYSPEGMKEILIASCPLVQDCFTAIADQSDNADSITKAWYTAMGIKDLPVAPVVGEAGELPLA